jgi:hypothetical protein
MMRSQPCDLQITVIQLLKQCVVIIQNHVLLLLIFSLFLQPKGSILWIQHPSSCWQQSQHKSSDYRYVNWRMVWVWHYFGYYYEWIKHLILTISSFLPNVFALVTFPMLLSAVMFMYIESFLIQCIANTAVIDWHFQHIWD